MALVIAELVANGQVFNMAVAAFAERLNVLQRGRLMQHMFATYPAGHHTMHLACYGFIDLVAGVGEFAHFDAEIGVPLISG